MVRSMTGFGRGEAAGMSVAIAVEIKTVNHRFLDLSIRGPRSLAVNDEMVRAYVHRYLLRGRVELNINQTKTGESGRTVKVDKELAIAYDKAMKELAGIFERSLVIELSDLARLPDILQVEHQENNDDVWPLVNEALIIALDNVVAMRQLEGERLVEDLLSRSRSLAEIIGKVVLRAPVVIDEYRERLHRKVAGLLAGEDFDPGRLATEIVLWAERCDFTEEVVRFKGHLEALVTTLKSDDAVGRKLDFILQELNREINTIGSKAQDLECGQMVVAIKAELEKMREQVQNLE